MDEEIFRTLLFSQVDQDLLNEVGAGISSGFQAESPAIELTAKQQLELAGIELPTDDNYLA